MNSTKETIEKEKMTEEKKKKEIANYFSFINQPNRRKRDRS